MSRSQKVRRLNDCVAHNSVLCLALGRKSGRVMATGGDDKPNNYVNMWAIGRTDCIMSLGGHTSPVEAVEFNVDEDKVAAGSMSGSLKVWDLEEKKVVRTLSGHGASIKSLDFHYAGYIGSGSMDTNVKLWDVRTKGCIYTYKGHTGCINMLRFSPDGRWFVSADEDGVIKIWDLSAGRQLTEFRQHTAAVHCVTFHPTELLLATSSSDRTVKFFDLERFELVSSTPASDSPSAIRRVAFHPEGNCIYAACGEYLKVYSYEPTAECLETISVGWRSSSIIDMTIAPSFNQLIAASPPSAQSPTVCTYVIDAQACAPFAPSHEMPSMPRTSNPVTSGPPIDAQRPLTQAGIVRPVTRSGVVSQLPSMQPTVRKNFQSGDRRQAHVHVSPDETQAAPQADDGEESYKVIDQDEYKRIFQPRHVLNRSPDDDICEGKAEKPIVSDNSNVHVATRQSPPPAHVSIPTPAAPVAAPSGNKSMAALIRQHSGGNIATSNQSCGSENVVSERPVSGHTVVNPPSTCASSVPKATHNIPAGDSHATEISRAKQAQHQIAAEDFLPKPDAGGCFDVGGVGGAATQELSDVDCLRRVREPHGTYQEAIECRRRNLQSVRTMWSTIDVRNAVNLALSQHDHGVLVDVLNVLVHNQQLWSLDLAVLLLPTLANLIQSRYVSHVESCCQALKLLLRKFSDVIRQNLKAPPSIGVDLSREERHQKCSDCYNRLIDIRDYMSVAVTKPGSVIQRVGPVAKELSLMMQLLDDHH